MTPKQEKAYIENLKRNKVAAAMTKAEIRESVSKLKRAAGLQVVWGDDADRLIERSGVLLYAAAWASEACQIDPDRPELRIMRGMANALGELASRKTTIEQHRPSIASGLEAIERLMPDLSAWALGLGLLKCEEEIAKDGFGTSDIEKMLGKPSPATA